MFYPFIAFNVNHFLFRAPGLPSGAIVLASPILCVPIALAASSISWFLLEEPISRLRTRFAEAAPIRTIPGPD